MTQPLSREIPIEPEHTALLLVDVQNFNCTKDGGEYAQLDAAEKERRYGYFFRTLQDSALPNMVRLQQACRRAAIEVTYTVVESMTADGRDRSLDYKITGFHVPKGSADALMVSELAPRGDEMLFPKTFIFGVHLDQHRLRAAQSGHEVSDHRRVPDRSMRGFGGARRLRFGISRNPAHRCLRDLVGAAARLVVAQQSRLLPPDHDAGVARGDRALAPRL